MLSRRTLLLAVISCIVATGLVASVVADELLGVITKVNIDDKKITVLEKDTDKEIEITITDDPEQVKKKGNTKVDLTKLEKNVKKAQDDGKKGLAVKVTHEKKIASKIEYTGKKGAGKKKDN
jgi:hypothetical protein